MRSFEYKSIDPNQIPTPEFHGLMLGSIAPRPIAFVSTIDKQGHINLSPYSFFNAFGSNPPTLIFSPARRVRDNTTKHSLENVKEVPEVVVNVVSYAMVEQMSLASTEYPKGINEFEKAGFRMLASSKVQPPRVAEAPAAFECIVKEVVATGTEGGAGNLVICEIVAAHFHSHIFNDMGKIDPLKIDLVARMGGEWYLKTTPDGLFEFPKPGRNFGIGVDMLPPHALNSDILSGNNLGRLGNHPVAPEKEAIENFRKSSDWLALSQQFSGNDLIKATHQKVKTLLETNEVEKALLYLFSL